MWTDGQTDMMKLIVDLHNFANAPKNWYDGLVNSGNFTRLKRRNARKMLDGSSQAGIVPWIWPLFAS